MSILKLLGLSNDESREDTVARGSATVQRILRELRAMDRSQAQYLAGFAYILSRAAYADQEISTAETEKMEQLVVQLGKIAPERARLVVRIAKSQTELIGGTEDFVVTREFKEISTVTQRMQLMHCLFAVSAADESISTTEEERIRQIARELGFGHNDYITVRSEYGHLREVMKGLPGEPPSKSSG